MIIDIQSERQFLYQSVYEIDIAKFNLFSFLLKNIYNCLHNVKIRILKFCYIRPYSNGYSFTSPGYTHFALEITGLINGFKFILGKKNTQDFLSQERC